VVGFVISELGHVIGSWGAACGKCTTSSHRIDLTPCTAVASCRRQASIASERRIARRSIPSPRSFIKRTFDIGRCNRRPINIFATHYSNSLWIRTESLGLFYVGINATAPIVRNLRYSSFERRPLISEKSHPSTGPMRSSALRDSVRSCAALAWISSPS